MDQGADSKETRRCALPTKDQLRTTPPAHTHHLSIIYGQHTFSDPGPYSKFSEEKWTDNFWQDGQLLPFVKARSGWELLDNFCWLQQLGRHRMSHSVSNTSPLLYMYWYRCSRSEFLDLSSIDILARQLVVIWNYPMHCDSTCPLLVTTKDASR